MKSGFQGQLTVAMAKILGVQQGTWRTLSYLCLKALRKRKAEELTAYAIIAEHSAPTRSKNLCVDQAPMKFWPASPVARFAQRTADTQAVQLLSRTTVTGH